MKTLFTFYFLLFTYYFSFSQIAPAVEWDNTIGGDQQDMMFCMQQCTDGGFILGGISHSDISGDKTQNRKGDYDYWIVKTNAAGLVEWDKTIGSNDDDELRAIQVTPDGGYILAGYSSSNSNGMKSEDAIGGYDCWVVKLSSTGNIQWENTLGGTAGEIATSIICTDDGYLLGAYSQSDASADKSEDNIGEYDFWVVKLDNSGNIVWDNTIGGTNPDFLRSVIQTEDGGYFLGGSSSSDISSDKSENNYGSSASHDYWIVKLNSAGSIVWENTLGGTAGDYLNVALQTPDGGYLLGGDSASGISSDKSENNYDVEADYWVVKTDASGNIEWDNTIGGNSGDHLYSIAATTDGGFVLCGHSRTGISQDKTEISRGGNDYWLVKIDSGGNVLWDKTVGGSGTEYYPTVLQAPDGGFIAGGYSASGASGEKTETGPGGLGALEDDYWIIKLSDDVLEPCEIAPSGLFADNIKMNKAKLHWTADPYAIQYKLQYRESTTTTWTTINTTALVKRITGLTSSTLYEYQVRSQCSGGLSSPWSAIETFTTLPLKEMQNEQIEFLIYPNPSNGNFTIQFPELNTGTVFISIKNILGEEIYAEELYTGESDHEIHLPGNISGGMYFVEMKTNDKLYSQQIIIAK